MARSKQSKNKKRQLPRPLLKGATGLYYKFNIRVADSNGKWKRYPNGKLVHKPEVGKRHGNDERQQIAWALGRVEELLESNPPHNYLKDYPWVVYAKVKADRNRPPKRRNGINGQQSETEKRNKILQFNENWIRLNKGKKWYNDP